ncbi:MAG: hypothetical protein AAGU27_21455 [Dehalobacterium sp.]
MKRFSNWLVCITLVCLVSFSVAFADSSSVVDKENKAKLYFAQGKGLQKFLNTDTVMKDGADTNISFTVKER